MNDKTKKPNEFLKRRGVLSNPLVKAIDLFIKPHKLLAMGKKIVGKKSGGLVKK